MVQRKLISLFCGPGGLDLGFYQAGFLPCLAYDNDKASVDTYNENHKAYAVAKLMDLAIEGIADKIIHDWYELSTSAPAGVIGGPPCQSFSVSNVHPKIADKRHSLPERYAEILAELNREFRLDFFVFENVPGLISKKHKDKFERFIELFEKAGFDVFQGILDAQNFGVAQMRPRVFVVGLHKRFQIRQFEFPEGNSTKPKTVEEVIAGLPEPIFHSRNIRDGDIPYHRNHRCMVPRSYKFKNGSLRPGKRTGRSFRVLSWGEPSYTVAYGNREVHIHPNCKRRLSVFEAMLLQGFPDNYVLNGTLSDQFRLVSEAVPPPVAQALAEALVRQLYSGSINNDVRLGNSCATCTP